MAERLSAVHRGPAAGVHLGKVTDPYGYGPTVPVTLCGISRNVLLDIYWRMTTSTQVTCRECYDKGKEMHDASQR